MGEWQIWKLHTVWDYFFFFLIIAAGYAVYRLAVGWLNRNRNLQGQIPRVEKRMKKSLGPETVCFSDRGFADAIADRAAAGDKIWWYVCCGPGPKTDYCNLFTQQEGVKHRVLFWQQMQQHVTGLLYWSTTYWSDVGGDPWSSAWTTPCTRWDRKCVG